MNEITLSRPDASAAVEALGWRVLLGGFAGSVPVRSLREGAEIAARAASCGEDTVDRLRIDVRADRVELLVGTPSARGVTARDVELAEAISAIVDLSPATAVPRPVQVLEIAIDALDIPAVRPFWRAVMAYTSLPGSDDDLVDPAGQGPSIWFQQMDAPRPERNRIHLDITVAHDEADRRVEAALAAGGVLVSDEAARAFWVLADAEGNEICVCTWQDRD
jgi:4a-hydroxytetrahydrobiopterin dehydratase